MRPSVNAGSCILSNVQNSEHTDAEIPASAPEIEFGPSRPSPRIDRGKRRR